MSSRARITTATAIVLLFAVLTGWLLELRPGYLGTRIPSDLGDPVLNLYFLEWGARSLGRGVRGYLEFWDAPFFFPARWTMTYADHLLGPAAQTLAFHRLWDSEVAAYDFLFLGSFVLSGLTASWVTRRAGASVAASLLAGVLFAFSPYRFDQRAHLPVLLAQWIPLLLWSWHRLLEAPSWRRAAPFVLCYALHVTGGTYLAYLAHIALAVLLAAHLARRRELATGRSLRVLGSALGLCALVAAAVFVPYLLARRVYAFERSVDDFLFYGATVTSFFSSGESNALWGGLLGPLARPENQLFGGLVATALAAVGIRGLWPRRRPVLVRAGGQPMRRLESGAAAPSVGRARRTVLGILLAIAVAGLLLGDLLTLGVAGKLGAPTVPGGLAPLGVASALLLAVGGLWLVLQRRWRGRWPLLPPAATRWERGLLGVGLCSALLTLPVVFAPLALVVPGLDGMRVPTRVYPFVSFALVYFAARGLDRVLARSGTGRRRALLAAVALVLAFELRHGMDWLEWPDRADVPPVFTRLAELPEVGAVLHLPIPSYPFESHYMYYSIANWRPIVNGYSGYEPPEYVEIKRRLQRSFFAEATIDHLIGLGVTHVVVHPRLFPMPRQRRRMLQWEERWSEGPRARLRLVSVEGRDRLWQLLPAGSPAVIAGGAQ